MRPLERGRLKSLNLPMTPARVHTVLLTAWRSSSGEIEARMYENRETTSHGVLWDTLRCNQNRIGSSEYSSYPAPLISEASRTSEGITAAKNMKVQQTNWVPRQQSDSGKRRNKWNKWIGSGLALILLAFAAQELATRLSATHA